MRKQRDGTVGPSTCLTIRDVMSLLKELDCIARYLATLTFLAKERQRPSRTYVSPLGLLLTYRDPQNIMMLD
jgi:hypothetical protein